MKSKKESHWNPDLDIFWNRCVLLTYVGVMFHLSRSRMWITNLCISWWSDNFGLNWFGYKVWNAYWKTKTKNANLFWIATKFESCNDRTNRNRWKSYWNICLRNNQIKHIDIIKSSCDLKQLVRFYPKLHFYFTNHSYTVTEWLTGKLPTPKAVNCDNSATWFLSVILPYDKSRFRFA